MQEATLHELEKLTAEIGGVSFHVTEGDTIHFIIMSGPMRGTLSVRGIDRAYCTLTGIHFERGLNTLKNGVEKGVIFS